MMRLTPAVRVAPLLASLVLGCGPPELQTFELTFKPVRDCKPAGLFGELCADRDSLAPKSRTARVTVEQRGTSDFIFYDDSGRGIPGYIDRGHYFAATRWQESDANGCAKHFERTVKFTIKKDLLPPTPQRPKEPDRMVGNVQARSGQNEACGQENASRFEEAFSGVQVDPEPTATGLPLLPLPGGG